MDLPSQVQWGDVLKNQKTAPIYVWGISIFRAKLSPHRAKYLMQEDQEQKAVPNHQGSVRLKARGFGVSRWLKPGFSAALKDREMLKHYRWHCT
jgi:hypothetical protein